MASGPPDPGSRHPGCPGAGATCHVGTVGSHGVVPSFGKAILSYLNAPSGRIATFTEIQFEDEDGKAIPDGAIIVEWGKTRWVCFVEVKTGDGELTSEQVNRYMRVAVANGFDAVLTISNQLVSSPDALPYAPNRTLHKKPKR